MESLVIPVKNKTIIKRNISVAISVICLFMCRYEFWLNFLPTTMMRLVQLLGIIYLGFFFFPRFHFRFPKKLLGVFTFSAILAVLAFWSSMRDPASGMGQFRMMLNLFFFFGICAYIVENAIQNRNNTSIGRVLDCWVYSCVIQMIITLLFFVNHGFYESVMSFLKLDLAASDRTDMIAIRMVGLGNSYFQAGFNYSIDLMVMALLPYVDGSRIVRHKIIYWIIVSCIIVVGFMSARTFLVGIGCTILFLCWMERRRFLSFTFHSIKTIVLLGILLSLFVLLLSKFIENIDMVLEWVFELFINFFEGDGLQTGSTNVLYNMYVFPESSTTWLWGDGKYTMTDGSYYMSTDVGFIRLIFFFGLPCTILFYWYRFFFVRVIYRNSQLCVLKPFLLCYVILEYLCNLKGFICGDYLLTLLLIYVIYFEKEKDSVCRI